MRGASWGIPQGQTSQGECSRLGSRIAAESDRGEMRPPHEAASNSRSHFSVLQATAAIATASLTRWALDNELPYDFLRLITLRVERLPFC
jgi:hypothetical protein